jgi:hypothetical protein
MAAAAADSDSDSDCDHVALSPRRSPASSGRIRDIARQACDCVDECACGGFAALCLSPDIPVWRCPIPDVRAIDDSAVRAAADAGAAALARLGVGVALQLHASREAPPARAAGTAPHEGVIHCDDGRPPPWAREVIRALATAHPDWRALLAAASDLLRAAEQITAAAPLLPAAAAALRATGDALLTERGPTGDVRLALGLMETRQAICSTRGANY